MTPGASSSTWANTQEGKSTTEKPQLFKNKKSRGNEKTKALLSLVLSSRGNETSKAPIQRGAWGREIPLQTHLREQLLKWKCCSSETFEFPAIARRRKEAEEGPGAPQPCKSKRGTPGQPSLGGCVKGVNLDQHTVLSHLDRTVDLEGRQRNE